MMIRTRMVMMTRRMRMMLKMMFRDFIDNTLKRKAQAKREKRGQDHLKQAQKLVQVDALDLSS